MTADRMLNYLALLKIRQAAFRRNVTIIGGAFLIIILATFALGMLSQLDGLSVYIAAGFNVAFLVSFITAWVRLEIVNSNIDLLNNFPN